MELSVFFMKKILDFKVFEMQGNDFQSLISILKKIDDPEELKILTDAKDKIVDVMARKTGWTKEEVALVSQSISQWSLDGDKKIVAESSVYMANLQIKSLGNIKFSEAKTSFYAWKNDFETLEGFPKSVGENFDVEKNKLKNLIGGPVSVGGDYIVINNPLDSLEGAPETIGTAFYFDSPDGKKITINRSQWNIPGCLEILGEKKSKPLGELMVTIPWLASKEGVKKIFNEHFSSLVKAWDYLPDAYKKEIIDRTEASKEFIEDSIQKSMKAQNKFF
jgi:hypothetical protein